MTDLMHWLGDASTLDRGKTSKTSVRANAEHTVARFGQCHEASPVCATSYEKVASSACAMFHDAYAGG